MSGITARGHRRRGLALCAVLVSATGLLAGCGGGSSVPGLSARPSVGPTTWLSSIPDTAAYRSEISVNNLQGLWTSAGLTFPPTVHQIASGAGGAASRQIGAGSQIGSTLWLAAASSPEPVGYNPLAITFEVSAGMPPNHLSLVQGAIDPSTVRAAMNRLGVQPVSSGASTRYTISNPTSLPADAATVFIDVRNLAVLGQGGRAAAGGAEVPPGDVIDLLRGSHPSRSLASDADVHQALGFLAGADVVTLGTALIASPVQGLGPAATPSGLAQLRQRLHLDQLPAAPTFAGYGYLPGHPTGATALAVAIYPNASNAKAAANILGDVLRSGTSLYSREPYSQLFAVDGISVHGDAVVARLTEHRAGVISQALQERDFPLFWSPLR